MRSKNIDEDTQCIFLENYESIEIKLKNGDIYEKIKKICIDKKNDKITFNSLKTDPLKYDSKNRKSIEFIGIENLIQNIDYMRWDI